MTLDFPLHEQALQGLDPDFVSLYLPIFSMLEVMGLLQVAWGGHAHQNVQLSQVLLGCSFWLRMLSKGMPFHVSPLCTQSIEEVYLDALGSIFLDLLVYYIFPFSLVALDGKGNHNHL
jgi:hypothetical protein